MWRRALGVATVDEEDGVDSILGYASDSVGSGGSVDSRGGDGAVGEVPSPVPAGGSPVAQPVAAVAATAAVAAPVGAAPTAGDGGAGGADAADGVPRAAAPAAADADADEDADADADADVAAARAGRSEAAAGGGRGGDAGDAPASPISNGVAAPAQAAALPASVWRPPWAAAPPPAVAADSDEETELFNNTTVHMDGPAPGAVDGDDEAGDGDGGGDEARGREGAADGDARGGDGLLGTLLHTAVGGVGGGGSGGNGGGRAGKPPPPPGRRLLPRQRRQLDRLGGGRGAHPPPAVAQDGLHAGPPPPPRRRGGVGGGGCPPPPPGSPSATDALDDDGVGDDEELSREELLARLQRARARLRTWEGAGRELLYGLVLNAEMNAVYAGMLREQLHLALAALPSVSSVEYLETSLPSVPREAPRMTLVSWAGLGHSTWDVAFSPRSWWVRARLTGAASRSALRLLSFSVQLAVTDVAVRGRLRVALSSDLSAVRLSWATMPAVQATVTSAVGWGTLPLPLQAGPLEARVLAEMRRWIRRRLVAPASMMVVLKRHRPPAAGLSDEDVSAAAAAAARAVVQAGLPSLF